MIKNHYKGLIGEYLVMLIYKLRFYQIIAHRIRNFAGEIDLVCKRFKTIVFIEVKTRSFSDVESSITQRQITRIKNAAQIFIAKNHLYQGYNMRFDFVFVSPFRFPHIVSNV